MKLSKNKKMFGLLLTLAFSASINFHDINFNKSFAEDKKDIVNFTYETYSLPGSLNSTPVFNSNSPEVVKTEGVLLSTFPKENKKFPEAHLNYQFSGDFDIFTHHIAVEREKGDLTTLYQGILVKNASNDPVILRIKSSASYRSQPDSPFFKMEDFINNNSGNKYAGPGDRVNQDILRNKSFLKTDTVTIEPNGYYLLFNEDIKIYDLKPPVNGRTALFNLYSSGPVYVADLALYENKCLGVFSNKPSINDWINILENGKLAEKRDHAPTPIDKPKPYGQPFYYGRVAGVAMGNTWYSWISNDKGKFVIPPKNDGYSYVLNTVYANTLDTKQVQSANIIKRYEDTAYQAHSNYGTKYEVDLPLYNDSKETKEVHVSFDTPIRISENNSQNYISFYEHPPEKISFRGELRLKYIDDNGNFKNEFIHIVQRFGQKGQPLVKLNLKPGETRKVNVSYIYPADATPPHVLTISTH